MSFIRELFEFLKFRKKLWLSPIVIVMVILGGLLVITQGSVLAPFIYTLFQEVFIYILGISAYYHDSAACLLKGDQLIAAAQEERFSRKKHDSRFPKQSINYCIEEAAIKPSDIEVVVFYDKPFTKFERILETYLAFAPKGFKSFSSSMQ